MSKVVKRFRLQQGFTLIEIVLVVVILGLLAGIAVNRLAPVREKALVQQTKHEMNTLAIAICGNPEIRSGGVRTDFGYVGDVGALPPNLDALISNTMGYGTWNGPYLYDINPQLPGDFKTDEWGQPYVLSGVTITSTGSGETLRRHLAPSLDDLLNNELCGTLLDLDGTPPGSDYTDSVTVRLFVPDGAGGTAIKTTVTDAGGYFNFDSIPIGAHELEIIYEPRDDTVRRYLTVTPGDNLYAGAQLSSNVWAAAGVSNGLIAHWKFDDAAGGVASDASGYGYDGDLTDMDPATDWVSGRIGGALDFDGVDDYVHVDYDPAFDLATGFTICGWFKIAYADRRDYRSIITRETIWTDRNWWICVRNNGSLWWKLSYSGAQASINPPGVVADGTWHHFAAVYDGDANECRLYYDGTLPAGGTLGGVSDVDIQNEPVTIGRGYNKAGYDGRHFKGQLDDIRIYDRPLTQEEVTVLANQ